jgi:hypothetical protein
MERDEFVLQMIKELELQRSQDAMSFERGWRPPRPSDSGARPIFDKMKFDFAEPDSTELECLTHAMSFHTSTPTNSNNNNSNAASGSLLPDGWQLSHTFLFNLRTLATRLAEPKTKVRNVNPNGSFTGDSITPSTVAAEASALAVVSLVNVIDRVLSAEQHEHVFLSLAPLLAADTASVATDDTLQQTNLSSWANVTSCLAELCALASYDILSALSEERWVELDATNTLLSIAKRLRLGQGGGVLNSESYNEICEATKSEVLSAIITDKEGQHGEDEEEQPRQRDVVTELRSMWPRFIFILRDRIVHRPVSVATIIPALIRFGESMDGGASTDAESTPNESTCCDPLVVSILADLVRSSDFARASSQEQGVAWDILFDARKVCVRSFARVALKVTSRTRRKQKQLQPRELVKDENDPVKSQHEEEKGVEVTAVAESNAAAEDSAQIAELSGLIFVLEFISSGDPRAYGRAASRQAMDELVTLGVVRTALTAWLAVTKANLCMVIGRFLMACARRSGDVALFLLKVPAVHNLVLSKEWVERSNLSDRVLCPLTLACARGNAVVPGDRKSSDAIEKLVVAGLGSAIDVLQTYATMQTSDVVQSNGTDVNANSSTNAAAATVRDVMELLMALDDKLVVSCLANGSPRVVLELTKACKHVEAVQRTTRRPNETNLGGGGVAVSEPSADDGGGDSQEEDRQNEEAEEDGNGDGFRGKLELGDRHSRITSLVKRVIGRLDFVQGHGNKAD